MSGIPLVTAFTLTIEGWLDQSGEPLTYSVSYIIDKPGSSISTLISDFSPHEVYQFYLPNEEEVIISITMKGAPDCTWNFNLTVTLTPNNVQSQLDATTNLLQTIVSSNSDLAQNLNFLSEQIIKNDQLLACDNNPACQNNNLDSYVCQNSTSTEVCSRHGFCLNGTCQCNSGYYLPDCSMNQSIYSQQLTYRQSLISQTIDLITSLESNMNATTLESILKLLYAATKDPYQNDNSTLLQTLSALNKSLEIMQDLNSSNNLTNSLQEFVNTLSNIIEYVHINDCGMKTNFSSLAINDTSSMISMIADLSLRDASVNQPIIFNSKMLYIYAILINNNQLSNLVIALDPRYPQLQFGTVQNSSSLPNTLAVEYTYLKKDPLSCNNTPSTNFMLEIKNGETFQPIGVSVPVKVTYSSKNFNNIQCPSTNDDDEICEQSTSFNGDTVCSCKDISIFDVKAQLINIYKNSQLYQLNLKNLRELFTHPPYNRWSFWVAIGSSLGVVITWVIVNTINKNFCMVDKITKEREVQRSNPTRGNKRKKTVPKKYNWCYKIFVAVMVTHPFFNIFTYNDPMITKTFRAMLFYLRTMILLGLSAAFAPSDPEVIFSTLYL
mgnify:FL=1